jgi:hypothetical protein
MTYEGTVYMRTQKSWGFIREDSGVEWFFHQINAVGGYVIRLGDRVLFELGDPIKLGQPKQAINIRLVESGADGAL